MSKSPAVEQFLAKRTPRPPYEAAPEPDGEAEVQAVAEVEHAPPAERNQIGATWYHMRCAPRTGNTVVLTDDYDVPGVRAMWYVRRAFVAGRWDRITGWVDVGSRIPIRFEPIGWRYDPELPMPPAGADLEIVST